MGARRGKRQRPCPGVDQARRLEQRFLWDEAELSFFPRLVLAVQLTRSPDPAVPCPCNLFPHFPLTFHPLGQSLCSRSLHVLAVHVVLPFAPQHTSLVPQ